MVTENKDLRYTFSFSERLHLQKDFERVKKHGRKASHPAIFVYSLERNDLSPKRRLGLITSSKIGIAVKRNRIKRLLREIFRLNKNSIKPGTDIIFVPRQSAAGMEYKKLEEIVLGSLKRSNSLI